MKERIAELERLMRYIPKALLEYLVTQRTGYSASEINIPICVALAYRLCYRLKNTPSGLASTRDFLRMIDSYYKNLVNREELTDRERCLEQYKRMKSDGLNLSEIYHYLTPEYELGVMLQLESVKEITMIRLGESKENKISPDVKDIVDLVLKIKKLGLKSFDDRGKLLTCLKYLGLSGEVLDGNVQTDAAVYIDNSFFKPLRIDLGHFPGLGDR